MIQLPAGDDMNVGARGSEKKREIAQDLARGRLIRMEKAVEKNETCRAGRRCLPTARHFKTASSGGYKLTFHPNRDSPAHDLEQHAHPT